jgi:hypothetical protein
MQDVDIVASAKSADKTINLLIIANLLPSKSLPPPLPRGEKPQAVWKSGD